MAVARWLSYNLMTEGVAAHKNIKNNPEHVLVAPCRVLVHLNGWKLASAVMPCPPTSIDFFQQ